MAREHKDTHHFVNVMGTEMWVEVSAKEIDNLIDSGLPHSSKAEHGVNIFWTFGEAARQEGWSEGTA